METIYNDLTKISKDDLFYLTGATLEMFAYVKSKVSDLKKQNPSISSSELSAKILAVMQEVLPTANIADVKFMLDDASYNEAVSELQAEFTKRGLGDLKDALAKEYYAETLAEQIERIHSSAKRNTKSFAKILGVNLLGGAVGILVAKQMKKNPFFGFLIGLGAAGVGQMIYFKTIYTPSK